MIHTTLTDEDHKRLIDLLYRMDFLAGGCDRKEATHLYRAIDRMKAVLSEARDRQFKADLASLGFEPFRLRGY